MVKKKLLYGARLLGHFVYNVCAGCVKTV